MGVLQIVLQSREPRAFGVGVRACRGVGVWGCRDLGVWGCRGLVVWGFRVSFAILTKPESQAREVWLGETRAAAAAEGAAVRGPDPGFWLEGLRV